MIGRRTLLRLLGATAAATSACAAVKSLPGPEPAVVVPPPDMPLCRTSGQVAVDPCFTSLMPTAANTTRTAEMPPYLRNALQEAIDHWPPVPPTPYRGSRSV